MANTVSFLGKDLTSRVVQWGKLEQVKDALLVNATLMTSEMALGFKNDDGFLSPAGVSMTGGSNWYNKTIQVYTDGILAYEGLVKAIKPNATTGIATILTENVLRRAADTVISYKATKENPGIVLLDIIRQAVDDDSIDVGSFAMAGAQSVFSGATINVNIPKGSNETVLGAIQKISALTSISVFIYNQRFTARAFSPYQGSLSTLRATITDSIVREWAELDYDYSSFNNRVSVGYPTNKYVTLDDVKSQRQNDIIREFEFSASDSVYSSDFTSSAFWGKLYLQRASRRRAKLALAAGSELKNTIIGDRFPVTQSRLGYVQEPFECIEARRRLDNDEVELVLAQLFAEDS